MNKNRNKKIGLIPLLYDEYNYGGVLQFYALKRTISNMGYELDIVKMRNNQLLCKKGSTLKASLKKPLIYLYRNSVGKLKRKKIDKILNDRFKKIDAFRSSYYSNQVVKHINDSFDEYDSIVCGSDQIWNPGWVTRRTMLADIPPNINKVIYAASMGCEYITEYEKQIYKPLVERIQHVSVREKSAKVLLDSFLDRKDIQVVLDPTLLLLLCEWEGIIKNPEIKEKYIFTYFLGDSEDYLPVVNKCARELGLKIVNIPYASGESIDNNVFGDYKIYDASPEEFLGLIKNAEIIFTDSFHACVFSTLFRRKYFVFERRGSTNMTGRIVTLQNHFHLSGRIIKPDDKIDLTEEIDYSRNDEYQEELRNQSLYYLEKSIEDGIS